MTPRCLHPFANVFDPDDLELRLSLARERFRISGSERDAVECERLKSELDNKEPFDTLDAKFTAYLRHD
jgi:hypothetical protein